MRSLAFRTATEMATLWTVFLVVVADFPDQLQRMRR
jgi:hypothetical protein